MSGRLPENPNIGIQYDENKLRNIWFAGGCFWGVEAYFARIYGVAKTKVGYANGRSVTATYHELKETGHAETVQVSFDPQRVELDELIERLFLVIDPTSLNKQGEDAGTQYRTGIYFTDEADLPVILKAVAREQEKHEKPVMTEVQRLENFCPAEEYHQDYLEKNPGGYCHINFAALRAPKKPVREELKEKLSPMQYSVTQKNGTEPPFDNAYWDMFDKGIYVDVVTGEPLFLSSDKFASECGWPSFSRPLRPEAVSEKTDETHGMVRTEVRSSEGDSHLGHVFDDGPEKTGGLRYCINSAALRFIRQEEMEAEGYGHYLPLLKEEGQND